MFPYFRYSCTAAIDYKKHNKFSFIKGSVFNKYFLHLTGKLYIITGFQVSVTNIKVFAFYFLMNIFCFLLHGSIDTIILFVGYLS